MPAIPASERTQTHVLNRAATGIGERKVLSDVEFMFTKHPRNVLGETDGISALPAKRHHPLQHTQRFLVAQTMKCLYIGSSDPLQQQPVDFRTSRR